MGIPVPLKYIALFPCSPKSKSWFAKFPVPQNCLYSPVQLTFKLVFHCYPGVNALVPLFHKTPGKATILTWYLIFSEPVPRKATVNIQATVQNMEYIPELDSRESQEYRDFVTDFCEEVKQNFDMSHAMRKCVFGSFGPGQTQTSLRS